MEDGFGVGWLSRLGQVMKGPPFTAGGVIAPGEAYCREAEANRSGNAGFPPSLIFQFLKNWRFFFAKVISNAISELRVGLRECESTEQSEGKKS